MIMDLSNMDHPENAGKKMMFKYCIFFWDKNYKMHVFSPEFDGKPTSWDVKDLIGTFVQIFDR